MDALDALTALDRAVLQAARGNPAWAVPVFVAATYVGAGWGLFAILPYVVWGKTRAAALKLFVAAAVTNGLVSGIKALVGRIRPCDALDWCQPLSITSPGGQSFPSGHAAGGFVFAAFIAVAAPRYAPLAVLYGALVAWSRVVLGVHYPIDVVCGSLLGASVGYAFARWRPRWESLGAIGRWMRGHTTPIRRDVDGEALHDVPR